MCNPAVDPSTGHAYADTNGYWMVDGTGRVYSFGHACHVVDLRTSARRLGGGAPVNVDQTFGNVVDVEPRPDGAGVWRVTDRGDVLSAYTFHAGSLDASRQWPGETVTSMSSTASGNGYWLFTTRGRVFTFGDAQHFGDLSSTSLNGPVLDSVATPSGRGYYMVASDGGVFAFGDAVFRGSMGGQRLNAPVMSLVPDRDNVGYWLVAKDGGIFAFEAPFLGSMGHVSLNRSITGMVRHGNGYLMVGEDGGVFNFSDQAFYGSLGATPPAVPIVSVASSG